MDNLQNVRTFLTAARLGSFAAAARSLTVAPSVVSKRINQLEHEFRVTLFHRSTRDLRLTEDGERLLPRCMKLFDERAVAVRVAPPDSPSACCPVSVFVRSA